MKDGSDTFCANSSLYGMAEQMAANRDSHGLSHSRSREVITIFFLRSFMAHPTPADGAVGEQRRLRRMD